MLILIRHCNYIEFIMIKLIIIRVITVLSQFTEDGITHNQKNIFSSVLMTGVPQNLEQLTMA